MVLSGQLRDISQPDYEHTTHMLTCVCMVGVVSTELGLLCSLLPAVKAHACVLLMNPHPMCPMLSVSRGYCP